MANIVPKAKRGRPGAVGNPYWQKRAAEAGLPQKKLAEILGMSELTISYQLRGLYEGGTRRSVIATILAWELMSVEQREELLARLDGRAQSISASRPRPRSLTLLREKARQTRERLGLTLEQVGVGAGLARARWEVQEFEQNGDMTLSDVARIGEALGLTLTFVSTSENAGVARASNRERDLGAFTAVGRDLPDNVEAGDIAAFAGPEAAQRAPAWAAEEPSKAEEVVFDFDELPAELEAEAFDEEAAAPRPKERR